LGADERPVGAIDVDDAPRAGVLALVRAGADDAFLRVRAAGLAAAVDRRAAARGVAERVPYSRGAALASSFFVSPAWWAALRWVAFWVVFFDTRGIRCSPWFVRARVGTRA
jgi:hypothetical protein